MCVLFRVSDESKTYRLFDTITQKIIISRDVIFEKEKGWDLEHDKTNQHSTLSWGKIITQDNDNKKDTKHNQAELLGQHVVENLNKGNTEINTYKNESHLL